MRVLVLLLVVVTLCASGCITLVARTERQLVEVTELARTSSAAADSAMLSWTAPSFLRVGCEQDVTRPARDRQRHLVLRLKGQSPTYAAREAEFRLWLSSAAYDDSLRRWWPVVVRECEPDTVARLYAMPGDTLSIRLAAGEYVIVVCNGAGCSCWSSIRRLP